MTPVLLPHLDLDQLRPLLVRLEADAHRRGWVSHGSGLTVYCLYDGADVVTSAFLDQTMGGLGGAVRVGGRYCARTMLPASMFDRAAAGEPGKPYEFLRRFALNVAFADDDDVPLGSAVPPGGLEYMRMLLRQPGIFGFAATYEAYAMLSAAPMDNIGPDTRIGDEPGAREVRMLLAVDALDRVHEVRRFRGDKPEVIMDAPMRGDISTSLRILVDTVFHRLPPATPEGFAERYPTINEYHARRRAAQDPDGPPAGQG